MVNGMLSLVVRLRAFSAMCPSARLCSSNWRRGQPTLVAQVVAQPARCKAPRVQHLLEAIDDKWLASYDYVQEDQLFELLDAIAGDHLI